MANFLQKQFLVLRTDCVDIAMLGKKNCGKSLLAKILQPVSPLRLLRYF